MKKAQILFYVKNLKKPVSLGSLELVSDTIKNIEKSYDLSMQSSSMVGGELMAMLQKKDKTINDFKNNLWMFLVQKEEKEDFYEDCYPAVFDLFTENWNYIFERNNEQQKSSLFSPMVYKPPKYRMTNELKVKIEKGIILVNKNLKFRIALQRWSSSYDRGINYLDSILDCCSSLEALFPVSGEIRLRIALYVYAVIHHTKKKPEAKNALKNIYKMYGIRNDFIHGNKIPKVSDEEAKGMIKNVAEVIKITTENERFFKKDNLLEIILETI